MVFGLIAAGISAAAAGISAAAQAANKPKTNQLTQDDLRKMYEDRQKQLSTDLQSRALHSSLAMARSGGTAGSQASLQRAAMLNQPNMAAAAGAAASEGASGYTRNMMAGNEQANQQEVDRVNAQNAAINQGVQGTFGQGGIVHYGAMVDEAAKQGNLMTGKTQTRYWGDGEKIESDEHSKEKIIGLERQLERVRKQNEQLQLDKFNAGNLVSQIDRQGSIPPDVAERAQILGFLPQDKIVEPPAGAGYGPSRPVYKRDDGSLYTPPPSVPEAELLRAGMVRVPEPPPGAKIDPSNEAPLPEPDMPIPPPERAALRPRSGIAGLWDRLTESDEHSKRRIQSLEQENKVLRAAAGGSGRQWDVQIGQAQMEPPPKQWDVQIGPATIEPQRTALSPAPATQQPQMQDPRVRQALDTPEPSYPRINVGNATVYDPALAGLVESGELTPAEASQMRELSPDQAELFRQLAGGDSGGTPPLPPRGQRVESDEESKQNLVPADYQAQNADMTPADRIIRGAQRTTTAAPAPAPKPEYKPGQNNVNLGEAMKYYGFDPRQPRGDWWKASSYDDTGYRNPSGAANPAGEASSRSAKLSGEAAFNWQREQSQRPPMADQTSSAAEVDRFKSLIAKANRPQAVSKNPAKPAMMQPSEQPAAQPPLASTQAPPDRSLMVSLPSMRHAPEGAAYQEPPDRSLMVPLSQLRGGGTERASLKPSTQPFDMVAEHGGESGSPDGVPPMLAQPEAPVQWVDASANRAWGFGPDVVAVAPQADGTMLLKMRDGSVRPYTESDERSKEAVEMLRQAPGYSYEYTDEAQGRGMPAGRQVGPMAQDLEKSKAGRGTVSEGADGVKRVDTGRLALELEAAMGLFDKRLQELEAKANGR